MKKGFTLIELLITITILGIVALITYPVINNVIDTNRQNALEESIRQIENAAFNYSSSNDLGYSNLYQELSLSELKTKGYLTNKPYKNPVTGEEMNGCVLYVWNMVNKQYKFKYVDECGKVVRGDVNSDGVFDYNDLTALSNYLSNSITLNEYQLISADINLDGTVDNNDRRITNKFDISVYGDVNSDGVVDDNDYMDLFYYLTYNTGTINLKSADLNWDGVVDQNDDNLLHWFLN